MPRSTGIEVHVDVSGLTRALSKIRKYSARIDARIERVLDRSSIRFHRGIVTRITNHPAVDTGWYRNSVTVEKTRLARSVGPTAEYSEFVELGTRYMRARPSTLPAWNDERPIFLRELKEALKPGNII